MKEKSQPQQPQNPDDLVRIAPDGFEGTYPFDLSLLQNKNQQPVGTSREEEYDD
jgi:hypothetical protein